MSQILYRITSLVRTVTQCLTESDSSLIQILKVEKESPTCTVSLTVVDTREYNWWAILVLTLSPFE